MTQEDDIGNGAGEAERLKAHIASLETENEQLRAVFKGMADGLIVTDADGKVSWVNPAAEALTGRRASEAVGYPLWEVFPVVDEESRERRDPPLSYVLDRGRLVRLTRRAVLISKGGEEIPVGGSVSPLSGPSGEIDGALLLFRDQTQGRLSRRFIEIRLSLIEYAAGHTLEALLTRALDEVGALVESPVGFYHFVEADQKTLSLQQWSTRTLKEFCRIGPGAQGLHYDIDKAGVWVDCVRQRRPVIHNDYAALPRKKGLPEGHTPVLRELVVPVMRPVMREDKVVAILGVGNKPTDYTQADVDAVSYLADVTWEIVRQKRADEAVRESEARFRQFYRKMSAGVARISMGFRIEDANEAYCRMLGYDEEELIGKHLREITHPETVAENLRLQSRLAAGEIDHYRMEKQFIRKDGGTVYGILDANLVRDADGTPSHFIGSVLDITDRKRTEAELFSIFRAAPVGIGVVVDRVFTEVNDRLREMTGYTREELIGKSARLLYPTESEFEVVGREKYSQIAERHTGTVETRWRRKDGGIIDIILSSTPIDPKDLSVGVAFTALDITDRKRTEAELIRLNADLAAKNTELEQVVYVASHDLRSPLVNIDGYSRELEYAVEDIRSAFESAPELLETLPAVGILLEEDIPEALRFIRTSAAKMDKLLNGLLRLSRSGRAALNIEPLKMDELMAEVLDAIEFRVREAGATVTVGDLPDCMGDAVQVNQIFSNLLDNALKYLAPDRPGIISIDGKTDGDRAVYRVSDNGIGIAEEHLAKIFDIFHRLDPTRGNGEGLGLTIVKRILGRLEGDIWVESAPGSGTSFYVALPADGKEKRQ